MVNKDWLDIAVLEDYLDGKLDAKTMNRVEREALEDPFVAEALAGLSESPKRSLNALSLLQKQLQDRVADHQVQKKRSVITWQRLSIAATAAVMFISVSVVFWMKENNRQKELASLPKKVDVNLAPRPEKELPAAAAVASATKEDAPVSVLADRTAVVVDRAIKASKKEAYASLQKEKVSATPESNLNEVVVKVYGTQRKQSIIGSSSVVMPDSTGKNDGVVSFSYGNAQKKLSINEALAGRVAGLETKDSNVMIRGNGAVNPSFEPVGGWDKFREYLQKKNRLRDEAKTGKAVVLSFNLSANGKPEDIKVLISIAEKYDQEAVRLLKKGPKWSSQAKGSQLFVTIDF